MSKDDLQSMLGLLRRHAEETQRLAAGSLSSEDKAILLAEAEALLIEISLLEAESGVAVKQPFRLAPR